MSVDYQLIAGIDSAVTAEKSEDGWYTIVRDGEAQLGELVTDKYRDLTYKVTGFGAPFYVAEVRIEDAEEGYYSSVIIDYHEAVNNFDRFEKIAVCLAFLEPVRHLRRVQQQRDIPVALAAGWS